MLKSSYPAELTPEPEGGFTVCVPDLPGTITYGRDRAEALAMAQEALVLMLAARLDAHEDIPDPSPLRGRERIVLPSRVMAKLALYQAMRDSGTSQNALAKRLGVRLSNVQRLLDLEHNSRMDAIDRALAALGMHLDIRLTAA